jgi:hypothetical protein
MNMDELEERINKLTCWDDWHNLEEELFHLSKWPEKTMEILSAESLRSDLQIDGYCWKPVIDPYSVSPEMQFLYEKIRLLVFSKLEPIAADENSKHPEWYGKWCVFCQIWTETYTKMNCPNCEHELLPIPIND